MAENFAVSFLLNSLSIFVHISGSVRAITLIWASLKRSFPPAEVEYIFWSKWWRHKGSTGNGSPRASLLALGKLISIMAEDLWALLCLNVKALPLSLRSLQITWYLFKKSLVSACSTILFLLQLVLENWTKMGRYKIDRFRSATFCWTHSVDI